MLRLRLIIVLSEICICLLSVQGIIIEGPSNVTYMPGQTPLPITLICNVTGFPFWRVNGTLYTVGDVLVGSVEGHNISGPNIVINVPMNDTEYICVSSALDADDVLSAPAFLYIAGHPAMIGNVTIDLTTVSIDNNNVRFTLNWDEPFDNFDPIVNYTITVNCNDASCPVMFTVTATSSSVSFITDLSMMTSLSVTAANTIGTSDPTMIIITIPGEVGMVNLTCGAMDLINSCYAAWNAPLVNDPSAVAAPISYTANYSGENITNGTISDIDVPMATIDLPPVDSDVNVLVTAMNVFGSGPSSNIVLDEIMSPSVIEATATLVTPNENRTLHSITVTCTINPDSTADMCEVRATANDQTFISVATINNGIAAVTVTGLTCEVEYTITAGGTLDGQLVGPRSSHGTVTAGPCPPITTTTTASLSLIVTPSTTTLPPLQPPPDTSKTNDDNTGAIVGGVVGGIIAAIIILIIIIMLVWCCMKKRKMSRLPISNPPVAMGNIPEYDIVQLQDPAVSDYKVKMETNPAYQEMPSDQNRKGPDPAYQELSSHSGRANVSKPAGDVNYYEDIISDQNIKMTENPSYAVP